MKRLLKVLVSGVLLFAGMRAVASAQQTPPEPAISKSLPPSFIAATNSLFADGMSDPRGGTYRAITIRLTNTTQGGKPVATHGWILPLQGKASVKRAVAWNGLTYDVSEDMGPADLKQDVETLIDNERQLRAEYPQRRSPLDYNWALSEAQSIDPQSIFPPKVSLLLRLNEVRLANSLYATWLGESAPREESEPQSRTFVDLASCWAGAAFNRAVIAHTRGNDRLAFEEATQLSIAWPKLEAQAAALGARQPTDSYNNPRPFFDFLSPVPDLLADSRRRLTTPESPVDLSRLKEKHPRQTERIAYLIAHFDDIAEYQRSNPGRVGLAVAPVSEALVEEGDAAVEPLLNVLDTDKRLTRSVQYPRSLGRWDAELLTVRQTASECLVRILRTTQFEHSGMFNTAAIRAYWNVNQGVPLVERWYRTLAGTNLSTPWLEAAANIVKPSNVELNGILQRIPYHAPGAPLPPMHGESLRTGHSPTVSALLARHIARITTDDGQPACGFLGGHYGDNEGIDGACLLAQWDPKAAQPVLTALMHRMLHIAYPKDPDNYCQEIGNDASVLTYWRIILKTPDAVSDYATFLHNISPAEYASNSKDAIAPLVWFRNDPTFSAELTAVAESLFNAPDSKWNPIAPPEDGDRRTDLDSADLIRSQLLCLPAFRRQVLRELDDQRNGGILVKKTDDYALRRGGTDYDIGIRPKDDQNAILASPVRVCDIYAWKLGNERAALTQFNNLGIPFFDLSWPQAKRDDAIAALKTYLLRFGDRLTSKSDNFFPGSFVFDGITLDLPPLDHAATTADVNAGRAIFSLDNPQAQLVQLPNSLPIKALRLTTTDPYQIEQLRLLLDRKIKWEEGKPLPWVDGLVYQAEEAEEKGKRQRYYGFVGPHMMERVPAEEVILIDNDYKPLPPL